MCKRRALSDAGTAADRTMVGEPVGRTVRSCSDPVILLRLAWNKHDHHFAPGTENLAARYQATNLSGDVLNVTVTDRAGSVVYQAQNTGNADGNHDFAWNGQGNQGVWNNEFITPLDSPYRARVEAANAGMHDDFEVYVLYHSMTIHTGTWTEDGAAPAQVGDPERWVQYKLNELGYFAGPVDGIVGDQTKRAMRRYLRMTPLGNPNMARAGNYHTNAAIQIPLAANQHLRVFLAALPAEHATAQLYVEHNFFYENFADFSAADGMRRMETAELDRPEFPLEVSILLVGRGDADGSGVGVAAPDAVGEVEVKWKVHDDPEDTSTLLASTANCPTRMRPYIDSALQATAAAGGEDSCPDTHGGARNTGGPINPGYFRIGDQLPPFTSIAAGNDVSTLAHAGLVAGKRGKAGILFRGSYIAGDNFRVEAQFSFAGRGNEQALTQAHEQLNDAWAARRRVSTGKMVVWRRMPIAGVIDWPASARHAINWVLVAQEFAHAYTELVPPPAAAMSGDHFLNNVVPGPQLATFENDLGSQVNRAGRMQLQGNAMFQIPIPTQGGREYAREYRTRINALLRNGLDLDTNYQALQNYTSYIQDFFKQAGLVGAIIIHGKWVPTIDLFHRPLKGLGDPVPATYDPTLSCVGLPYGVTVLSQEMFTDFSDQFAVPHEMGHTRFLKHHEKGGAENNAHFHARDNPSANPADHDTADHNCTMCYPWLIPSRNRRPILGRDTILEWSPASAENSAFCGKCLLKLRGWDLSVAGLPAHS